MPIESYNIGKVSAGKSKKIEGWEKFSFSEKRRQSEAEGYVLSTTGMTIWGSGSNKYNAWLGNVGDPYHAIYLTRLQFTYTIRDGGNQGSSSIDSVDLKCSSFTAVTEYLFDVVAWGSAQSGFFLYTNGSDQKPGMLGNHRLFDGRSTAVTRKGNMILDLRNGTRPTTYEYGYELLEIEGFGLVDPNKYVGITA